MNASYLVTNFTGYRFFRIAATEYDLHYNDLSSLTSRKSVLSQMSPVSKPRGLRINYRMQPQQV
jgi:hypothetical protein